MSFYAKNGKKIGKLAIYDEKNFDSDEEDRYAEEDDYIEEDYIEDDIDENDKLDKLFPFKIVNKEPIQHPMQQPIVQKQPVKIDNYGGLF